MESKGSAPRQGKRIVISINASWNIVNFRMGLVRALLARGDRVIALAPRDAWSERLTASSVVRVRGTRCATTR